MNVAKDTKEKILDAALEIFARDGFAGTNIKDIAESVGIVKSALYRHFESKEEMWNAVLDMMIEYYDRNFGTADRLPSVPKTAEELYDMTMHMVDFTIHDRRVIQTRKILLTEQFRDDRIRALASKYFLYDTEAIFAKVFEGLMNSGSLKKRDPYILALSYTAPITALIHLCDREPEKESEALDKADRFVRQFIDTYGIGTVTV